MTDTKSSDTKSAGVRSRGATRPARGRPGSARPVIICWLVTRGLLFGVAAYLMTSTGASLTQVLTHWDVEHYQAIARHGYADPLDVAFFPGLPLLMACLGKLGLPIAVGTAVAAQLASGLAAWALYRIGGAPMACLWLLAPMTLFTAVPYTEPFFCAAAFWAWERGLATRWTQAGALAALGCTLRISGLFLIAALGIMVLTRRGRPFAHKVKDCCWLLLPAAVLVGYVIFLHQLTGSWTAWYSAQGEGWQRNLSTPWAALQQTLPLTAESYWPGRPEVPIMFRFEIVSVALGYLTAAWCLLRRRWAEFTWVAINVLVLSCSGWFMSVNRAVLLWFPLFGLLGVLFSWRPKSSGGRSAWTVLRILLLSADLALICWWGYLFGTGGWSS